MNLGKWIGLVIFIICLDILWQVRQLFLLVFTAVILAVCFNLVLEKLQEKGLSRGKSILLCLGVLLINLVVIFFLLIPPFTVQFRELSQLVPRGIERSVTSYNDLANGLDPNLVKYWPKPQELLAQIQPIVNKIASQGLTVFYSSLGGLLGFLLLFALTMMIVTNPHPYRQGFIRFFPAFYRSNVDRILIICEEGLREWLLRIITHMVLMTCLSLLGLAIIGIPLCLAQALMAGLLTFIPYLGPLLGIIPPLALALLSQEAWKFWSVLILFWGIYLIIQRFDQNPPLSVLRTRFVRLVPAFTILGQIICAILFGFTGLFLAVPLLIVGYIWFREVVIRDILDDWKQDENYSRNQ